ncbi:MAG: PilZ domain-containing protein [Deltaproteobacteria bacterium]|nr:PilZ domain-containing protein [Deltaproteobacteria bacterium]
MMRLTLPLAQTSDWLRVFDPRGGGLFVPMQSPPETGTEVRVEVTITEGGPRVILKGNVLTRRAVADGRGVPGCTVALAADSREKINFLNGFVRGGLINRRERRRLPLRLPVTFGTHEGPKSAFSRDINEEGIFIITESPYPEGTVVHFCIFVPGRDDTIPLRGSVGHTVVVEDQDIPGMGIVFTFASPEEHATVMGIIDDLEDAFYKGTLPDEVIT